MVYIVVKQKQNSTHLVFLYEPEERRSLYLYGLAGTVVQGYDEVKEVGLSEVAGRLLLEVCPSQTHAGGGDRE